MLLETPSMSSSSRPQTDRLDQEGFSPPSFTHVSARTGAHVDQKNETTDDRYMHTEKSVTLPRASRKANEQSVWKKSYLNGDRKSVV